MRQAWYMAEYASILKPWSETAHIKRKWPERYLFFQARMTSNLVLKALKQICFKKKYNLQYTGNMPRFQSPVVKQPFQARMTCFTLRSSPPFRQKALNG